MGERYTHDIIPNRTVCIEQGQLDGNRTVWKNPDSGITFDNVWIAYIALFQVHINNSSAIFLPHFDLKYCNSVNNVIMIKSYV